MTLARKINAFMSYFDVALTRRSTLDVMISELSTYHRNAQFSRSNRMSSHIDGVRTYVDSNELLRHQIASKWEVVDYVERLLGKVFPNRTCPLCGYAGSAEEFLKYESHCIFGGGNLTRYQCPTCNVVYGADKMFRLSNEELSQDYEWHYKVYSEGDSTEQEIRAFHALSPVRSGRYLNYGSGVWSRSTQILRSEGWDVYSYEPHASTSDKLDYVIDSRDELLAMRFDGIFSNNVLEHLRYPVDELSFMRGLLRPDGSMSHATPCYEYLYEYTRFHLFFFLGRSRELLAEKAGLTIINFISDGEFMDCVFTPVQK